MRKREDDSDVANGIYGDIMSKMILNWRNEFKQRCQSVPSAKLQKSLYTFFLGKFKSFVKQVKFQNNAKITIKVLQD